MHECPHEAVINRVDAATAYGLAQAPDTLILDVRRREAFAAHPDGLSGAVPLLLEPERQHIPDVDRDTPILVYCLCSGEASSMRAALWLWQAGYRNVAVLRGGFPAWRRAGLPTAPIAIGASVRELSWIGIQGPLAAGDPMVAERVFLDDGDRPVRRDIAVVFVDMVDSTALLFESTPERALELLQGFMEVVVDTTVRHCGDVHDFEGDGAMLYFAGVGEALPAVFDLREALARRRSREPALPEARFAITTGPVLIGYVGTRMRRTAAFIGPCVNAAARILHLADPDGIVATEQVVEQGRDVAPDLAGAFHRSDQPQSLKGWERPVNVYHA